MKIFPLAIICATLFLTITACTELTENTSNIQTENVEVTLEDTVSNPIVEDTIQDTIVENNVEPESKFHYDLDWNQFKQAVLAKDIAGMAAFASSDGIDSEALLSMLSESYVIEALNNTSYEDLSVSEQDTGTYLEFSASISETDEDGNEFGSGIMLYFIQSETGLLLDYYIAAG